MPETLQQLEETIAIQAEKLMNLLEAFLIEEEQVEFMANAIGEAECRLARMKSQLRQAAYRAELHRAELHQSRRRLRQMRHQREEMLHGQ